MKKKCFFPPLLDGVRGRLLLPLLLLLSIYNIVEATNEVEKFTEASDIVAVTINGKPFKVHEQNHVPAWNAAPSGGAMPRRVPAPPVDNPARIVELKNLMITGTLPEGIALKNIEITTADKHASVACFSDRTCTQPLEITGTRVKSGEQVYYLKALAPDGLTYQVYTLSIMGLNSANHAQYYKYGEPTFVADSYHTWIWALQNAQPGQRIAVTKIEQYLYKPDENQFRPQIINKHDLVIRSFSGSHEDLILHGHGFHKGAYNGGLPHDELFMVIGANTKNIVVYGITVMESTANGFKISGNGEENIIFDNCRTIDVTERAFKGSGPQENGKFTRSKNISIINCRLENTQVPLESDHMAEFNGDYIGGIDVMNISGITIAGNIFKNITGKNGGGRGAIFLWGQDGCENVLIENNLFINCDRGIALGNNSGNPSGNSVGGFYVNHGIVRNNIISNSYCELIELNRVNDVKIYNNTLWRANTTRRGIRDSGGAINISHNVSIINNIICGAVNELPRGNNIDIRYNIFSFNEPAGVVPGEGNITFDVLETFFMNVANGDFRLRESAAQAFKKGIPLAEAAIDFFGIPRGPTPDLGAYQCTSTDAAK